MDFGQFDDSSPELLSVRKLANVLDCSPKTVRDWLYKDRKRLCTDPLPYYRLNGLVRFKLKDVLAWIERRRVRVSPLALMTSATSPRKSEVSGQNL